MEVLKPFIKNGRILHSHPDASKGRRRAFILQASKLLFLHNSLASKYDCKFGGVFDHAQQGSHKEEIVVVVVVDAPYLWFFSQKIKGREKVREGWL